MTRFGSIRLAVPAFAVCSNRITSAQADKVARWCHELGVVAAVLFDGDVEGEAGAQQAVLELAKQCPVRLAGRVACSPGAIKIANRSH